MKLLQIIIIICFIAISVSFGSDRLDFGGVVFPKQLSGELWSHSTNYALENAVSGIGVSYRNPSIKIDLYLYDSGDERWMTEPLSERLNAEFANIPNAFMELERRKIYTGIKFSAGDEVGIGSLNFRRYKISYSERDIPKKSYLYMSQYKGKLLKVRITAEIHVDESDIESVIHQLSEFYKE